MQHVKKLYGQVLCTQHWLKRWGGSSLRGGDIRFLKQERPSLYSSRLEVYRWTMIVKILDRKFHWIRVLYS